MTVKKLRVLLLADAGSVHTERFAGELKRQGCHVMTASLENGAMRYVHLKRMGPVKSFHYLLAVPQVKSIIKRFRPDVINAHYASGYGFIAARAAGDADIPVVLNLWGSDVLIVPDRSTQGRIKTKTALERADFVIGDSQYLIDRAEKLSSLRKREVIPWGIERKYLELHKASYEPGKPLKVITPRAHEEVYNNGLIVEALRPLVEAGEVELTFPDFGSRVGEFRGEAGDLLESGVTLYRKMTRPAFLKFLSEHDVFLSASRSDSSPASLIEAMALGLIPVAADIEGVREWLTVETGFVFEQDKPENLRAVIVKILEAADPCEDIRRRNLERVKSKAVFEENVARQIEIMAGLVKGSG